MSSESSHPSSTTQPSPSERDLEQQESSPENADAKTESSQEGAAPAANGNPETEASQTEPKETGTQQPIQQRSAEDSEAAAKESEKPARRIKIGSQRDGATVAAKPQVAPVPPPLSQAAPAQPAPQPKAEAPAPPAAKTEEATTEKPAPQSPAKTEASPPAAKTEVPPPPPSQPIPKPSVRDPLGEDLEAELESALGGGSIDQLMSQDAAATAGTDILPKGTKLRARVIKIHGDSVFADIKQPAEGVLPLRQFGEKPPGIGEFVDAVVLRYDEGEGLYELGLPEKAVDAGDWDSIEEGMVVEAYVTGLVKGGLECKVGRLRGFIPASQASQLRIDDLSQFLGEKWPCVVTECKPKKRNLVLSHRAVLDRQREEARKQLLQELEIGQIREGVVRTIKDFGAFIDLGGVDGLLPVSQLSWTRVKHPSDVLQPGQRVKVKVQKFDADTEKISLSIRDLLDNPWNDVEEKYPAGTNVKGRVTKVIKFGALVELEPGVEGMIHISELDYAHVHRVTDIVNEGDEVETQVLSVEPDKHRIGLSLKATKAPPEKDTSVDDKEAAKHEQAAEEARKTIKKRHRGDLKGGLGRKDSEGDKFGLKW